MADNFDLQPDPRILPMLGEINLPQWQCVAELIDNSIDGFLHAVRQGEVVESPRVVVNIPTSEGPLARITVVDNGPGMDPERLERAVRAGWTGNNPVDNLGMFGMGFNIATARLGAVTTVWTTMAGTKEWHGLKIDFDELRRQRSFRTPHLTRPKGDPRQHGTEIIIERLKPEQITWLVKVANRGKVKRDLSRAYSSMLRTNGVPIHFNLEINGTKVIPYTHCVWDESRSVETQYGPVHAIVTIDEKLPDRLFCMECSQWLGGGENVCPSCLSVKDVRLRKRHVHGWIGLQRYLSPTDFGFDFVRNGRKIEVGNKDLFLWRDGEVATPEYPTDDVRGRGRFVGEIHLDHCRVTYTKDRFDRTDPAWEDMVSIIRGQGPLRPVKAEEAGFGHNSSPLYRLYQAFRRNSPPRAKKLGGWRKVLVVKDNEQAEFMAKKFHDGDPGYQTDAKWWALVEEEDIRALSPELPGGGDPGDEIPGFSDEPGDDDIGLKITEVVPTQLKPPQRSAIPSLTREYLHDRSGLRWEVKAFEVKPQDPELEGDANPWRLRRFPTGEFEFYVNTAHPVFMSATMTTLDALLCQLAWTAADSTRDRIGAPKFPAILADLRDRYGGPLKLDLANLSGEAAQRLISIARTLPENLDEDDARVLFGELSPADQAAIYNKMAIRSVKNSDKVIADGRFLEYAAPRLIATFVVKHPELFLGGRCWEESYDDLVFPDPSATEEARSRVVDYYQSLLLDAVWLTEQQPEDLSSASWERLLRASLAIELLAPDLVTDR